MEHRRRFRSLFVSVSPATLRENWKGRTVQIDFVLRCLVLAESNIIGFGVCRYDISYGLQWELCTLVSVIDIWNVSIFFFSVRWIVRVHSALWCCLFGVMGVHGSKLDTLLINTCNFPRNMWILFVQLVESAFLACSSVLWSWHFRCISG
jgi:hypothetical protein